MSFRPPIRNPGASVGDPPTADWILAFARMTRDESFLSGAGVTRGQGPLDGERGGCPPNLLFSSPSPAGNGEREGEVSLA